MIAGRQVAPGATLGFGMFGQKATRGPLPPATVYEINTRQKRKAGVGFSLKF